MPPIDRISVWFMHWHGRELDDAIAFVEGYGDDRRTKPVERYEIDVRYKNGDVVRGEFKDKDSAMDFLWGYQPVVHGTTSP